MRVVTFQNTAVTVNFFIGKCYLKNKYLADFIFATIKSRDKMNNHHSSFITELSNFLSGVFQNADVRRCSCTEM